jgi:hypothetical protein
MICASAKKGVDCFLVRPAANSTAVGAYTIAEKCTGCQKAQQFLTGTYCLMFPEPATKWRIGNCNMATHIVKAPSTKETPKLNPLKASKRASGH